MMTAARRVLQPVTVSSGTTDSDAIELNRGWLAGIFMPSALTSLTFAIEVSTDGVTFVGILDEDGTTALYASLPQAAAGSYIRLDREKTYGFPYARIVTASNEGADRQFDLIKVESS